jgi:hypothetical protein
MPVTRQLAALLCCGAAALVVATAGCSKGDAKWSDPERPRAAGEAAAGPTDQGPPPKRRNSLEMSAETIFFLEGVLPVPTSDGTTSALAGSLVLRGQCHEGTLKIMVSARAENTQTTVDCDGEPHERELGQIKLGDPVGVRATGRKGTDFAIELAVQD